jgi:glycosyltransferase involved in cell wall biosynthesis
MRILMLSQSYPPFIGGVAMHVRTLSVELLSHGHDVAVVTQWYQGQAEFELDQGVRVYRFHSSMQRMPWLFSDNGRQHAPPFPDPEVVLALRRIIMHEQPEIVHAHNWLVYSFLPLKAWSGARLVMTLHNHGLVCVKTTLLFHGSNCDGPGFTKCLGCAAQYYGLAKGVPAVIANWVMGLAERGLVDMFLPVSQAVAVGSGLVGSRLPFQVVHNFIPDDLSVLQGDIEPYLAQLPAQDYLLFVGALNQQKGVDVLLRAYANLTNAPPLVLIGYQTPDWPILSMDCPANVFVLENWPRYAVMEAWRRSIIALLPSVGPESCPTAVMEAMTAGRPVIASRIGGLVDLVADGETGLLVEPGNPSALRQAIERLLANPDLRRRMGQVALRKVVEFQASTVVPRIEHVYEELLQKANPSRKNGLRNDSLATSGA